MNLTITPKTERIYCWPELVKCPGLFKSINLLPSRHFLSNGRNCVIEIHGDDFRNASEDNLCGTRFVKVSASISIN